jgi:hypothetical protein
MDGIEECRDQPIICPPTPSGKANGPECQTADYAVSNFSTPFFPRDYLRFNFDQLSDHILERWINDAPDMPTGLRCQKVYRLPYLVTRYTRLFLQIVLSAHKMRPRFAYGILLANVTGKWQVSLDAFENLGGGFQGVGYRCRGVRRRRERMNRSFGYLRQITQAISARLPDRIVIRSRQATGRLQDSASPPVIGCALGSLPLWLANVAGLMALRTSQLPQHFARSPIALFMTGFSVAAAFHSDLLDARCRLIRSGKLMTVGSVSLCVSARH